jgi:misacylated tRNA(Ala) deacylase
VAAPTQCLFRDDPYLQAAEAEVLAVNDRGGIILDRTLFYATSGGQPGDTGSLTRVDGAKIRIAATVTGETKDEIVHVPEIGQAVPAVGETVALSLDWDRRYRLMRMHTACHLLTVVCPYPITGASVGEEESRVDFDIPDAGVAREDISARLMALVTANHPIYTQWISDDDLAANPSLVKSKNVRPPSGTGRIRLVCIGKEASVDSQPCGGTHVDATGEVGAVHISKIEKKGRENRRFRIRFGEMGAG